MKCLVTGGAGFIGSNLALTLEQEGHTVTIIDNLFSGTKENLKAFNGTFIEADVADGLPELEKLDAIFHIAAITDPRHDNDQEVLEKNVQGFKHVLARALKDDAKLIYASTAGVYGNGPSPQHEDQEKELLTAYAISKLITDEMGSHHWQDHHIVGLRYFNVFGPREAHKGRPASMIYHLVQQMRGGNRPKIFKMGEHKRDHIYVKDVVRATIMALDAKQSGIYNIGTGRGTSFNELVAAINEALGTDLPPEYIDSPYDMTTYQDDTRADMTRTEKYIGFKAEYSVLDGIKDYLPDLK